MMKKIWNCAVEEWLMKMIKVVEMAKLTTVWEKTVSKFIAVWKPLIVVLHEIEHEFMVYGFED